VQFTAKFRAADNSTGSNFEIGDKFKAELFIDGSATPVALLPAGLDVGDGSPSHLDPGTNGAPNGYLNGFNGVAPVAPATVTTDFLAPNATYPTAADHYFGNKVRDEFNALGQPVTASLDNTFDLSYTIPAGANSVKLVIYGAGAAGSESFTVKDVLFVGSADPDTDLDGMSDSYETANGLQVNVNDAAGDLDGDGISNLDEFRAGTAANDPNSALRILSIVPAATAGQHTVTWSSVAGKSYQLEESSDLGPTDAWVNFGAPISSAGATTSFTGVLPGAGRHFVRVKVR
jgi:hypothetical protein